TAGRVVALGQVHIDQLPGDGAIAREFAQRRHENRGLLAGHAGILRLDAEAIGRVQVDHITLRIGGVGQARDGAVIPQVNLDRERVSLGLACLLEEHFLALGGAGAHSHLPIWRRTSWRTLRRSKPTSARMLCTLRTMPCRTIAGTPATGCFVFGSSQPICSSKPSLQRMTMLTSLRVTFSITRPASAWVMPDMLSPRRADPARRRARLA